MAIAYWVREEYLVVEGVFETETDELELGGEVDVAAGDVGSELSFGDDDEVALSD